LLAVLFGTGSKEKNVETLSRELITEHSNLTGFLYSPISRLLKKKGLGRAKVAKVSVLRELIYRVQSRELIKDSKPELLLENLADLLFKKSMSENRECFYLLTFSQDSSLINLEILSKGSLKEVGIKFRDLIKMILDDSASFALVAHNHPLGNFEPSDEDYLLYDELKFYLSKLDIELLDQWIIGKNGIFSCRGSSVLFSRDKE
jgi:DNA repair protein RadC